MDRLRMGLVGGGPWARAVHGPALAAHAGVELAGVWTRRLDVGRELAGVLGRGAYDGFDEILADVDAVAFAVRPRCRASWRCAPRPRAGT